MRTKGNEIIFFLLVCFLFVSSNELQVKDFKELKAPQPKKEPVEFEHHGVKRIDNYYWMRDDSRKKPEVIEHLKSENKYLEKWFETDLDQRDQLFEEITSRIPKKEDSVPIPLGSYAYFRRYEPDNEHAIYIRKKLKSSEEEIILDVNKLAKIRNFIKMQKNDQFIVDYMSLTGHREFGLTYKPFFSNSMKYDDLFLI